jgi:CDGSH iron-sulfur domain-containing protein 3
VADPVIAQKAPYVVDLAPGRYSWCTCGLSARQPFCDGAHRTEGVYRSLKFEVATAGTYHLCGCKQSGTRPFCDGTHDKL